MGWGDWCIRVGAGSAEKGEPVASKVAAATAATMQQPNVTPVPLKAPFWYRYRAAVGGLLLLNLGIGGEPNPNPPIASLLSLCFSMGGCILFLFGSWLFHKFHRVSQEFS